MENKNIEVQGHCLSNESSFRKNLISRINRIAGQLRGIEKMILAKVVLEAHLRSCVVEEIKSGFEKQATSELIETLSKLMDKNGNKTQESNDNIIRKVEKQIATIKECIEKDECCSSILKEIALIKNELDSMSKVILEGHIRNCLVRDIKLGLEEKVVDDFLYTINKMIK